jgi:hypothetical protein
LAKKPISLISAIGPCPTDATATPPSYVINEATTVASVYALSGFLTQAMYVSSSGTPNALAGVRNAFAARSNLVDFAGIVLLSTPGGNGTAPQGEINELANMLNLCVSTAIDPNGDCKTLFNLTVPPSTSNSSPQCNRARDTVCALRNIIDHPDNNVPAMYSTLNAQGGVYQPTRTGLPTNSDWTLVIPYGAPNLLPISGNVSPWFLAIDKEGNVWATAFGGKSVTEFGPQGNVRLVVGDATNKTSLYGLNFPTGIAIDHQNNVWVGNNDDTSTSPAGALSEFSESGGVASLAGQDGFMALTNAASVAVDVENTIWLLTTDALLCNFANPSGMPICDLNNPYSLTLPKTPGDRLSFGLAIDKDNHVWIASHPNATVVRVDASNPTNAATTIKIPIAPNPVNQSNMPIFLASNTVAAGNGNEVEIWASILQTDANGDGTGGGLVAFDESGNPLLDSTGRSIVISSTSFTAMTPTPAKDKLCLPRQLIFDGAETLWVANEAIGAAYCSNASLSHYDHTGQSLSTQGLAWGAFIDPQGIAIDPSGNIWIAESGGQFVAEVIGAAVPLHTPANPQHLGQRP